MSFSGKTVLITGASGGFGAAAAKAFSDQGANLVLGDISETGLGEGLPATTATLVGDVRDPAYHKRLVAAAVDRFGALDIAVNNAGVVHTPAKIPHLTEEDCRKVIDVNLLGVMWAMQAQLPVMEAQFLQSGQTAAVVNLSSVAGLGGAPWLSIYGASKHGVIGLTRAAALEYARKGIRVNSVCPSFAETTMAGDALDDPEVAAHMTRGVPMRRLATVGEVIQAILWAANPENSFTTGQSIAVDGGLGAL